MPRVIATTLQTDLAVQDLTVHIRESALPTPMPIPNVPSPPGIPNQQDYVAIEDVTDVVGSASWDRKANMVQCDVILYQDDLDDADCLGVAGVTGGMIVGSTADYTQIRDDVATHDLVVRLIAKP